MFPFTISLLSMIVVIFADSPEIPVRIQKCCGESQVLVGDRNCRSYKETGASIWTPEFSDKNPHVYELQIGLPNCGSTDLWPVYEDNISDKLELLPDGTLRHYSGVLVHDDRDDLDHDDKALSQHFIDYRLGSYCIDKHVFPNKTNESTFAMLCVPDVTTVAMDVNFIITKILDPFLHIVAIICYASVAVIHFVLPQLRDLVGNIITSVAVCLVIGQAADLIRIFAEYNSYLDYFITDVIMFGSLLSSYLWISLLGFYIWKTFRSRNVFLRITDGRKYCYYSFYVYSCTGCLVILAVFSHFMLDTPEPSNRVNVRHYHPEAETIGWLAMSVFFAPIAFTILMDIYFFATTRQVLNRMTMYGRIHHKLKYSFDTYTKLFLVMTVAWIFFVLSWLSFNGTNYSYILSNGIEGPLILYISVLRQKKVRFLLKKSCCYEGCICPCFRPDTTNDIPDWGEEMMSMNL